MERIMSIMPEASVLLRSAATEAAVKQVHSPRILPNAAHGFFFSDQEPVLAETRSAPGDDLRRIPSRQSWTKWMAHIKDPLLRSDLSRLHISV